MSRRRRGTTTFVGALAFVGAAATAACTTIFALDEHATGNGGDAGTAGGDGGNDEGGTGDGAPPDGGDDDAPSIDAPASDGARLCARQPTAGVLICDDFDDAGALDGGPWKVVRVPAGNVALGQGLTSAPYAVSFTAAGEAGTDEARIEWGITGPVADVTCDFELYIDVAPGGQYEIGHLELPIGGSSPAFVIVATDGIKTPDGTQHGFGGIAPHTQVHYHFDVNVASHVVDATLRTQLGTTDPFDGGESFVFSSMPTGITVSFGLRYVPGGAMAFRIDDVYCVVR